MRKAVGILLTFVALAGFTFVLYRTAWLCDDAHISYRTVENLVDGNGLRWNTDERVQAFTHPLWLFLNAAVYFFTRENFLTWILLTMFVTMGGMSLLTFGLARTRTVAILGVVLLVSSRGFMDYSTSGLENPLTHVLLALFLLLYFKRQWGWWTYFGMAFVAGLGVLNRMDCLLLFAPALFYAWLSTPSKLRGLFVMAAGFVPFGAWEIFSVIYYGFPVPNTAYAKLGTGIPDGEMAVQGLRYFAYTLTHDPTTLPIIVLGLLAPWYVTRRNVWPISLGMVLYLLYIVKIGGDFMGGRFFAAPLFVAVCMLVRVPARASNPLWPVLGVLALLASMTVPHAPFLTSGDFNPNSRPERAGQVPVKWQADSGIGDERRFWYPTANLLAWIEGQPMPQHKYVTTGKSYRESGAKGPVEHGSIGYRGFYGGPQVHIVDYYALGDPLLARLPARYYPDWRIGHFIREVPEGYLELLSGNPDAMKDENLRKYNEKLEIITRGPLFSKERFQTILEMNAGVYDPYIDRDLYQFFGIRKVPVSLISARDSRYDIQVKGAEIALDNAVHNSLIQMSFTSDDDFQVLYFLGDERVAALHVPAKTTREEKLEVNELVTPVAAIRQGYDKVRVLPFKGDKHYAIGHFVLK